METELEVVEGMACRGDLSPYFITDAEKMICEWRIPHPLSMTKKLAGLQSLLPLLAAAVVQSGRPLLIIVRK